MLPERFRPLFWDTNLDHFDPRAFPEYAIERVLEHGDPDAVAWLLETFSREEIRQVLRTSRHLTARSASFWTLYFELPAAEVPALGR